MSELHQISGCGNAVRRADVLFIHGLGGDAFATWRYGKDNSTSWPHWLGEEFPDVGIWSLGYAASPTRWARLFPRWLGGSRDSGHSMPLPDRGLQVLDLMVQRGFGQRPILFVCHSLGGLLAKHILRKAAEATQAKEKAVYSNTRAVLFLATPHQGAELASLLNAFRMICGATVSIEDLRAHDAHLRDLFDWYRNHAGDVGIQTVTYFEMRSIKGVLPIVNPTTAHPGVGDDPIPLDEDHLSIAKPRSRDEQVCGAARSLLRDHVLVARSVSDKVDELVRLADVLKHGTILPSDELASFPDVDVFNRLMDENKKLKDENERLRVNDEERIQLKAIIESIQRIAKISDVSGNRNQ